MNIPVLSGISGLVSSYDAFIVDLWGVIFEGGKAYDGVIETLYNLKSNNKKVVFLTNSSKRSETVAKSLEKAGIDRSLYYGLLSSGEIIHHEMKARKDAFFNNLGFRYFHIGPVRTSSVCDGLPYFETPTIAESDFILLTGVPFEDAEIDNLKPVLERGLDLSLPMICCNPDLRGLKNNNPTVGTGHIAKIYEKMGGRIFLRGKPDNSVFKYCLEGLSGISPQRVAVIGDSFETDITGAAYTSLDAVFIAGGVHMRDLKISFGGLPSNIAINELARHYGVFPKVCLPRFLW